jgi:hypothetical protein
MPMSSHLSVERIASFDHEPFTPDELAHLAVCALCRAEREAMVSLVSRAAAEAHGAAASDMPRLVTWEAIASGLRADGTSAISHTVSTGTLRVGAASTEMAASGVRTSRWGSAAMRRAAAALLLVGGGAVLGRFSAAGPVGLAVSDVAVGNAVGDSEFTSVDNATQVLARAQRDYERASMWLASNDSTVRSSDVYRARLAALDQMMAASRAALRDAPQDPVLNHYYLAAYTAREATLQALGGTLPVDKVIERY